MNFYMTQKATHEHLLYKCRLPVVLETKIETEQKNKKVTFSFYERLTYKRICVTVVWLGGSRHTGSHF